MGPLLDRYLEPGSRWSAELNHLWFTFPGTRKEAWKCWGPGLNREAEAAEPSRDLGAVPVSPSWRRRGLNPELAFQPAPCPLLAAALGLGAAVSPAEEEETERGATPGSGFRTNAERPGRPPAAVPPPRHHVPQSWRARRGEPASRLHPRPLPSATRPGPSPRQPPSPAYCAAEMETPSPESCVSSAACSTRSPPPPGRRDGAARFANLQPLPGSPDSSPSPSEAGVQWG